MRPGYTVLRTQPSFERLSLLFAGILASDFWPIRGTCEVPEGSVSLACENATAKALRVASPLAAAGFPSDAAWQHAPAVRFAHDWQGRNADAECETEVRLLWVPDMLYLRFHARYRTITVFENAAPNGRRDELWNRDVAEVFLQPAELSGRHYLEFEVSPNGFWIDLEILPQEKRDLQSGLKCHAAIDQQEAIWSAELALPMKSLTAHFDPSKEWRVNFYRVEGRQEPRFYSAWMPTGTPAPNFHVPESFGRLTFEG